LGLREVFGYEYPEISRIEGKSEANCRQIAHRGRQSGWRLVGRGSRARRSRNSVCELTVSLREAPTVTSFRVLLSGSNRRRSGRGGTRSRRRSA
jgi:methyl coenzyme M reductase subunit C